MYTIIYEDYPDSFKSIDNLTLEQTVEKLVGYIYVKPDYDGYLDEVRGLLSLLTAPGHYVIVGIKIVIRTA